MQLVVLGDGAGEREHGADPAHDLLDGRVHELRLGQQELALVGEAAEPEEPAGDGVAGGLVARHHQHRAEHQQLVVGELVHAVLIGATAVLTGELAAVERLGEHRDDVVRRMLAALLDELLHQRRLPERLGGRLQPRVLGVGVAVPAHHVLDHL